MPEARSSFMRADLDHVYDGATTENLTLVPLPNIKESPGRIQIQAIEPIVDCGRFAIKRTVGDRVDVYATVFKDGHDTLGGALRVRAPGEREWQELPLRPVGDDRWGGAVVPHRPRRGGVAGAAGARPLAAGGGGDPPEGGAG